MTDRSRTDAEFQKGTYTRAPAPEGTAPVWLHFDPHASTLPVQPERVGSTVTMNPMARALRLAPSQFPWLNGGKK